MAAKKAKAGEKPAAKGVSGRITADTALGDVVARFPQAVPVMLSNGLHCVGCHVAAFETVGQGAAAHGMGEEQVKKMIREMNEALE